MATRNRLTLLLTCCASLTWACTQPVVTQNVAADAVTADTAPPDATVFADAVADILAGTDAQATDLAPLDGIADVQALDSDAWDVHTVDTPAVDTAPQPDSDGGCAAIIAQIDALKPKLTPCNAATTCSTFEYPICNTFGCFQTPLPADADTAALESLAKQASAASCDGFHCGCGPSAPSFCLKGQCRQCPPDCDGTCDEIGPALLTVAHAANWCGGDQDCAVLGTGMCPVGDLPCGGLFLNKFANQDNLQAIVTAYSTACGASFCKCAVPGPAVCVKGKCVQG